jgi:hypothetical protein
MVATLVAALDDAAADIRWAQVLSPSTDALLSKLSSRCVTTDASFLSPSAEVGLTRPCAGPQLADPTGATGRLVPNVRRTLWSRVNEMFEPSRHLSCQDFLSVAARLCALAAQPPSFMPRPPPPEEEEEDDDDYGSGWGGGGGYGSEAVSLHCLIRQQLLDEECPPDAACRCRQGGAPAPADLGVRGMRARLAPAGSPGEDLGPVHALAKVLDGSGGGGHEAALLYPDFGE